MVRGEGQMLTVIEREGGGRDKGMRRVKGIIRYMQWEICVGITDKVIW